MAVEGELYFNKGRRNEYEFWGILGISPTSDKNIIREAYMSKLSFYHPEEDPEGFQVLRQAYESALKYSASNDKKSHLRTFNEEDKINKLSEVEIFINKVYDLYDHYFERINEDNWIELLKEDVCIRLDNVKEVGYKLLRVLMERYYLPHEIWKVLDNHFSWSEEIEELEKNFPENFCNYVIANINNKFKFRYHLFEKSEDINHDDFIRNYYDADYKLGEKNYYDARRHIDRCKEICSKHPDIGVLDGRYNLAMNNVEQAIECFSNVIKDYKDDLDAYLNRAEGFVRIGRLKDAYEDYKVVLAFMPDNVTAVYGLAENCFCMGYYSEALKYFERLKERYNYNILIKNRFISCNKYLIDKYEGELKYKL